MSLWLFLHSVFNRENTGSTETKPDWTVQLETALLSKVGQSPRTGHGTDHESVRVKRHCNNTKKQIVSDIIWYTRKRFCQKQKSIHLKTDIEKGVETTYIRPKKETFGHLIDRGCLKMFTYLFLKWSQPETETKWNILSHSTLPTEENLVFRQCFWCFACGCLSSAGLQDRLQIVSRNSAPNRWHDLQFDSAPCKRFHCKLCILSDNVRCFTRTSETLQKNGDWANNFLHPCQLIRLFFRHAKSKLQKLMKNLDNRTIKLTLRVTTMVTMNPRNSIIFLCPSKDHSKCTKSLVRRWWVSLLVYVHVSIHCHLSFSFQVFWAGVGVDLRWAECFSFWSPEMMHKTAIMWWRISKNPPRRSARICRHLAEVCCGCEWSVSNLVYLYRSRGMREHSRTHARAHYFTPDSARSCLTRHTGVFLKFWKYNLC